LITLTVIVILTEYRQLLNPEIKQLSSNRLIIKQKEVTTRRETAEYSGEVNEYKKF